MVGVTKNRVNGTLYYNQSLIDDSAERAKAERYGL